MSIALQLGVLTLIVFSSILESYGGPKTAPAPTSHQANAAHGKEKRTLEHLNHIEARIKNREISASQTVVFTDVDGVITNKADPTGVPLKQIQARQGVVDKIRHLEKKGVRFVAISAWNEFNAPEKLEHMGLGKVFNPKGEGKSERITRLHSASGGQDYSIHQAGNIISAEEKGKSKQGFKNAKAAAAQAYLEGQAHGSVKQAFFMDDSEKQIENFKALSKKHNLFQNLSIDHLHVKRSSSDPLPPSKGSGLFSRKKGAIHPGLDESEGQVKVVGRANAEEATQGLREGGRVILHDAANPGRVEVVKMQDGKLTSKTMDKDAAQEHYGVQFGEQQHRQNGKGSERPQTAGATSKGQSSTREADRSLASSFQSTDRVRVVDRDKGREAAKGLREGERVILHDAANPENVEVVRMQDGKLTSKKMDRRSAQDHYGVQFDKQETSQNRESANETDRGTWATKVTPQGSAQRPASTFGSGRGQFAVSREDAVKRGSDLRGDQRLYRMNDNGRYDVIKNVGGALQSRELSPQEARERGLH